MKMNMLHKYIYMMYIYVYDVTGCMHVRETD